ncbi:MAG: tyrosine-protein phosphatase [Candidatus Omnitrophica bacterium]|nr:tyrosine-protein phosphatase [Candidatus Omnitrophota bacterium]
MKRLRIVARAWSGCGLLLCAAGCATTHLSASRSHALPAFTQVDEGLYRGGQPSQPGLEELSRRGIKTIISLRQPSHAMEEERRLAEQLGMEWVNIPMWFWWRPSDRQVRQFLDIATDPARRPVFVHCRQGWNRAGIMVAVYRIAAGGWAPRQAYVEARHHGLVWWNLLSRHLLFYEARREFARLPAASATAR